MFGNKVLQAISNTGTGTYQLNSTGVGAWKSWRSQFATGTQVFYFATREDGSVWEFGRGTLTYGTPDILTRTLVSSSTGALIDWVSGDGTVYVMSTPVAAALEGRWDSGNSFFVPAHRRSWAAVGAANKTVALADAAGRFSFDNSAAARSVVLPAISTVPVGFNIEVRGLSAAYALTLTPNGSEVIDAAAGGASLTVPGRYPLLIASDGSQWRTDYDYSSMRAIRMQSFTSSGTYTPDANMICCTIECWGGGGAGGAAYSSAGSQYGGGGGGGGGYARKAATRATVGASQAITIGAGGAGAAGPGGNGGTTSCGSLCSAGGGAGGGHSTSTAQGGGGGAGLVGDILGRGSPGGAPFYGSNVVSARGGTGGSTLVGSGGAAEANATAGRVGGGGAAAGYGAGGAGATSWETGTVAWWAGGNGTAGLVVVTEYCTA